VPTVLEEKKTKIDCQSLDTHHLDPSLCNLNPKLFTRLQAPNRNRAVRKQVAGKPSVEWVFHPDVKGSRFAWMWTHVPLSFFPYF